MCGGSGAVTVTSPPAGMRKANRARVQVQPLADTLALEERRRAAVLAVAQDGRAEQRAVRAQLVGTAGQRLAAPATRRGGRRAR